MLSAGLLTTMEELQFLAKTNVPVSTLKFLPTDRQFNVRLRVTSFYQLPPIVGLTPDENSRVAAKDGYQTIDVLATRDAVIELVRNTNIKKVDVPPELVVANIKSTPSKTPAAPQTDYEKWSGRMWIPIGIAAAGLLAIWLISRRK